MDNSPNEKKNNRRKFLRVSFLTGLSAVAAKTVFADIPVDPENESGEMVTLLSPDGKLVKVAKEKINYMEEYISPAASRQGIPHRKFVMVIDLAKCKNARKCVEKC